MTSVIYEPKGKAREFAPLACNPFQGGCSHRCAYCFVPKMPWATDDDREAPMRPKPGDILTRIERDATRIAGDPRPVLLSFSHDVYPPEITLRAITREALRILRDHDLHWTILTKGDWRTRLDFHLYRKGDTFATSIVFADTDREWEPYAAPIGERWANLRTARAQGIRTWVSVEPVIYPDQALEVIRRCKGRTNAVKVGKLNYHPHAKTVDWYRFGDDLAEVLQQTDLPYLVKDSLAEYMPEGFPLDTLKGAGHAD